MIPILLSSWVPARSNFQDILVVIYAPISGEVVQGQIPIDVGIVAPGYTKVELEFSYTNLNENGWFLLAESGQIPFDGILTQWDTTLITDGEYDLRLVALNGNDTPIVFQISNIRVRNYSPIETDTPMPEKPTDTVSPGLSTVVPESINTVIPPTITPFPTNPAIFNSAQLIKSTTMGVGLILVVFIVLGLYIGVRQFIKN